MLPLRQIISGGQTGADRGGLEAGRALGLETGGVTLPGFMTAAGPDPSLREFGLIELSAQSTLSRMYAQRSRLNVNSATATVAFRTRPSPGTDSTIGFCLFGAWYRPPRGHFAAGAHPEARHRPLFIFTSAEPDADQEASFRQWVVDNGVAVLNVAGHRDAALRVPVRDLLTRALAAQ